MEDLKSRVEKYLEKAKPLFVNLKRNDVEGVDEKILEHFHDMAVSYHSDALSFYEKGDYINSLAALEYAEGWLDAGAALGVFDAVREV
ncbi:MAG: hypothetical protein A7316_10095 [Candidatus Altiarchaeales archaeon WOR_SM1_86-2]|nr:MAG: hypothetical protein A7316_10095 [Candidatus Altiarchaeales archaeon WOR_SM1_86-2]